MIIFLCDLTIYVCIFGGRGGGGGDWGWMLLFIAHANERGAMAFLCAATAGCLRSIAFRMAHKFKCTCEVEKEVKEEEVEAEKKTKYI